MSLPPARPLRRIAPYLLLVPLLAGAEGKGCKACRGEPDEIVDTDEPIDDDVQDVTVALQVVSIDPAEAEAAEAFEATLYGAAFADGASVVVGESRGLNVQVRDENTIGLTVPGLAAGVYDVTVVNPDGQRATMRRGLRVREGEPALDCSLVRVHFAFDEAKLTDDSRSALDGAIPCLQQQSRLVLQGHTDERGTISYNLGLGERRAHAVSRHLQTQGVLPSRIETVSYGEERPLVSGHTESAWAQNRRVEIHAR